MTDTDMLFEKRKNEILNTCDSLKITGTAYYVSADGNDKNDGKTPKRAWRTLKRVSEARLMPGDGVLFRRGDIFRGSVRTAEGVSYGAFGRGEKPKLYGSPFSLADPLLWELFDKEHNIWKCTKPVLDAGTLVFNGEKEHSRKLIPTYRGGKYVCREDENRLFVMAEQMTQDLDLFWRSLGELTQAPSKGESFPVPAVRKGDLGELYLRCDGGNPGRVFFEIESLASTHMFTVETDKNVTIDNLCIKYAGRHGISADGHSSGLSVTNCEIGWIGGAIQHFTGEDPNYPEGKRGSVTRYGNAVEVYGGCDNYTVSNNYIYQVYDAAVTHQVTTDKKVIMTDILYENNLIDNCVYGIEYFLDQINGENESYMENVVFRGNFIKNTGYGWGQQRHNKHTPAAIKGWSYTNTAKHFEITDNVFELSAFNLLHLCAEKGEYCPVLRGNTYIQTFGGDLGYYGSAENGLPEKMPFDEKTVREALGDREAKIILAD